MSSCCSTDPGADTQTCPQCGTTGPVIGHEPVQPHRHDVTDGSWQHCATLDCPVVYYLETDVVNADEVRTQVAHKALDKPTPVCFCFSHTPDDLVADLAANDGASSIKAAIKAAVADGFCACSQLDLVVDLNESGQQDRHCWRMSIGTRAGGLPAVLRAQQGR